jgi:hypothetical protein
MTGRLIPLSKISDKMDGSPPMTKSCKGRIIGKDGKMVRLYNEIDDEYEDIPQDEPNKCNVSNGIQYKPSPRQGNNDKKLVGSLMSSSHGYTYEESIAEKGDKQEEKNVRAISRLLKDMEK